MKTLVFVFTLFALSCASIPIPKDAQVAAATSVACAVVDASGCYQELSSALPGLSQTSCVEVVNTALKLAENAKEIWKKNKVIYGTELNKMLSTIPDGTIDLGYWDPLKVDASKIAALRNGKCSKVVKALGVK